VPALIPLLPIIFYYLFLVMVFLKLAAIAIMATLGIATSPKVAIGIKQCPLADQCCQRDLGLLGPSNLSASSHWLRDCCPLL
jgi:hypothetical protein